MKNISATEGKNICLIKTVIFADDPVTTYYAMTKEKKFENWQRENPYAEIVNIVPIAVEKSGFVRGSSIELFIAYKEPIDQTNENP